MRFHPTFKVGDMLRTQLSCLSCLSCLSLCLSYRDGWLLRKWLSCLSTVSSIVTSLIVCHPVRCYGNLP